MHTDTDASHADPDVHNILVIIRDCNDYSSDRNHTIHLIHHSFLILMLYAHLISICLPDGTCLIRPFIPHMTMKVIYIVRLLLPDPEHLAVQLLMAVLSKRQRRNLFGQIITIYHTKLFDRISTGSILPFWPYLFSFRTGSVSIIIFTLIDKNMICVTHMRPPISISSKADIRNPLSLLAHERSRLATFMGVFNSHRT